MKKLLFLFMFIVLFAVIVASPLQEGMAFAEAVEVMGSIGIHGTQGVDGVRFPDASLQTTAVDGSLYQKRVTGSCSEGYAISSIYSGGTVSCEPTGVTGVLSIEHGGTGISSSPSGQGMYLRSTGLGGWSIGNIQFTDLPSLSGSYIDLTTDQNINGDKTFNGSVSTSDMKITNGRITFTDGTPQDTASSISRIMMGTVGFDGVKLLGNGFDSSRLDPHASYSVVFSKAFASTPMCVCTISAKVLVGGIPPQDFAISCAIDQLSPSGFNVTTYMDSSVSPVDGQFTFFCATQ